MSNSLEEIRDRLLPRVQLDLDGLRGITARLGDIAEQNSDVDLKGVAQRLDDTVSRAELTLSKKFPLGDVVSVPTQEKSTPGWRDQIKRDLDDLFAISDRIKALANDMQDQEIACVGNDLYMALLSACNTMTVKFFVNGVADLYKCEDEAGDVAEKS